MFCLVLLLGSFGFNENNNQEVVKDYLAIQKNIAPFYKREAAEEKLKQINAYLVKYKERAFNILFLNKFKNDLELIVKMKKNELNEFEESYTEFVSICVYDLGTEKNDEKVAKVLEMEKLIWNRFGKYSYMHLNTVKCSLGCFVESYKKENWENMILEKQKLFENSEWKSNYELSTFNLILCSNYENTKDFVKMEQAARKSLELDKFNLPSDDMHIIIPQSFILKSLVKQKKNVEALSVLNNISRIHMEFKELRGAKILFRIFSSGFYLLTDIKSSMEALAFKKLAIDKIEQLLGSEKDNLKTDAGKLRDSMLIHGDYYFMRYIEKRYNIMAAPKQEGEK